MKPKFYECGICGAMHSNDWHGDCRDNESRFDTEELDEEFGRDGWEEVPMVAGEKAVVLSAAS